MFMFLVSNIYVVPSRKRISSYIYLHIFLASDISLIVYQSCQFLILKYGSMCTKTVNTNQNIQH